MLRNLDNLVSKRELNTIIFELDRATLKSVILKDDISALSDDLLSTFTLAQISEFVDCAIKNNCTNCTAYLLNYKNEKFGEDNVVCLLRHIRNAIAHGNVYYLNAGNRKFILFEDFNEKSKPTARILFSQTDLKKLKDALLR